jgi:hypothetical protein
MLRRCLRIVALILIVLPEPFTTALGIALLTVTLKMKGGNHSDRYADMEALIGMSLKRRERGGSSPWTAPDRTAVYHELNRQVNDFSAAGPAAAGAANWFDNRRISGCILHHTLQNSLVQYAASPAQPPTSGDLLPAASPAMELHTLKTGAPPLPEATHKTPAADGWKKRFFTPEEVVFHTLKTGGIQA